MAIEDLDDANHKIAIEYRDRIRTGDAPMADHPKGTGLLSNAEWHTILTPMPVPCVDVTVTQSVRFMITVITDPLPQAHGSLDMRETFTCNLSLHVHAHLM